MDRNSYPWARTAGRTPVWVQPGVAPVEPPPAVQGRASLNARIDGWTMRFQARMRSSSRFFVWCVCLFVILTVALDGVLWNLGRSDRFCTWYLVGLGAL